MHKAILKLTESGLLKIKRAENSEQVATLEEKAGLRFPRSFRQLLSNFKFQPFELGGVEFFGNDAGGLSQQLFSDAVMSETLLAEGFLQVGRPDTGAYDPVCFNLSQRRGEEAELVIIDHEQILIKSRVRVSKYIAPSFPALLERAMANKSLNSTAAATPPPSDAAKRGAG